MKRPSDGGRTQIIATARQFFAQKGFHQTGMAELAERSQVSVGQIYRLFNSKSDIIIAIVQSDSELKMAELEALSLAVQEGSLPVEAGFQQMFKIALNKGEEALTFEILAEAFRNPAVAEVIGRMCDRYREILRRMIGTANPTLSGSRLESAEEILLACLFGLGNRGLSRPQLPAAETAAMTAKFLLAALL